MGFCGMSCSRVGQIGRVPIGGSYYEQKRAGMGEALLLYNNNNNKSGGGGGSTLALAASLSTSGGCSSSSSNSNSNSNSVLKVKLGKKWKEYQGVENWEGLLDPLDDNLRKEILRYGQFVDAAYKSFDFDPCSPSYGSCLHPKSSLFYRAGLPSTGYRVSKHLRATSGIRLPRWLHNKAPNSSWIGYVAICQDKHEISRLGRRDVVIALRGTGTWVEWMENVRATLTRVEKNDDEEEESGAIMVERGFLSLYTSETESCPSLRTMVREEIRRVVESYAEPVSLTITGHSLGAALAILAAYDIKEHFKKLQIMVTVMSFGGPRVGNSSFRKRLEKQGTKVLRIVNSDDVITKLPGFLVKERSSSSLSSSSSSSWIHKCLEDTQLGYSEVGRELRLSSRDSPHLTATGINNVANCHDLNTYLHLVDGFVSSTCPFRATGGTFIHLPKTNN